MKSSVLESNKVDSKNIKTQQSGSPENLVTPSPIPIPTVIAQGSSTPTPTPTTKVTPTPVETAINSSITIPEPESIHDNKPTNLTKEEFEQYGKPTIYNYSVSHPIPTDVRTGRVELIFKDEYKVRYNREKLLFISETNADLTNINNIIKEFKANVYGFIGSELGNISQEEADFREKSREERYPNNDYPNSGSMYELELRDVNIYDLIVKLRKDNLVRQSNYKYPATTD